MSHAPLDTPAAHPIRSYPQFLWKALGVATDGSFAFYAWMTALTAVFLVGVHAFALQTANGLALTAMTDHVSWGMYIGNFTFAVGLAAGAVMMVIPAYPCSPGSNRMRSSSTIRIRPSRSTVGRPAAK